LDLKQLSVFIEVADQASFSRAADILGMAQASVSARIASLEQAIGAKVFDRMGRRVELTRAGELLLGRARQMIALRDEMVDEMNDLLGLQRGEVLIGGSTAPGEYILPALLGRFHAVHPEVTVHLRIGDSDQTLAGIENGDLEIGVVGRRDTNGKLVARKTWTDRVVLVVRPDHPWVERTAPITAADLAGESWVLRERGSGTRTLAEKALKKVLRGGFEAVAGTTEFGSVTAVKEGVKAGLGVTLISQRTVDADVRSGTLEALSVEGLSIERHFYLVRDSRRELAPAAGALWTFILSEAGKEGSSLQEP